MRSLSIHPIFCDQIHQQGLWALLVAVIVLTALLLVWFQDTGMLIKGKKWLVRKKAMQKYKNVYARLVLDAILQQGIVSID